ncbi:MAG: hypothetical protein KDA29_15375, partial [Phycisphaerales bacterium]|nr:hypothetical protein [Phycisphaerales bacterium]
GIGACWSIPVLAASQEVLGTFAISSPFPRSPNDFQFNVLNSAARIASIAIQTHSAREKLLWEKVQAESATKAKSEFLANMSHEIRTPMTAILGFTELLLEDEATWESAQARAEALQTIHRNGEHLLEVINDVLDISKVEAGKLEVELVACRPQSILQEVIAAAALRAKAKGISLQLTSSGGLPAQVFTDPTRVKQILVNLVGN